MDLADVVERVADRYMAKCWWCTDRDDLEQEAWVAVLEAKETWDPEHGAPLHWYAWKAAVLQLRNYLWAHTSPVTGPKQRGEVMRGLKGIPLNGLEDTMLDRSSLLAVEAEERWWADLAKQVQHIVKDGRHGALATRALLGPETAAEVALATGWSVSTVKQAAYRARHRIRTDLDLHHDVGTGPSIWFA